MKKPPNGGLKKIIFLFFKCDIFILLMYLCGNILCNTLPLWHEMHIDFYSAPVIIIWIEESMGYLSFSDSIENRVFFPERDIFIYRNRSVQVDPKANILEMIPLFISLRSNAKIHYGFH